ncbi:hypothetical protein Tco_0420552 [Tanacetum coccineum]
MVTSKRSAFDKCKQPVGIRLFVSAAHTESDMQKAYELQKEQNGYTRVNVSPQSSESEHSLAIHRIISASLFIFVGIKSLLNAASITTAHMRVNAA